MLDNNYPNLYDIDFYNMRMYFLDKNESIEFNTIYAYVNVLFVESKKCFEVINDQIVISGESEIIYAILNEYPNFVDILKEVYDIEKITYVGNKHTFLEASVMVCEKHLKNIEKNKSI